MFQNNDKISLSQLGNIIALTTVGTGILTLPRNLAEAARTDGWLVLVIGTLLVTFFTYLQSYIIKKLPMKTFQEITTMVLPKAVAKIYILLLIIYFAVLNGFLLRIFGEVVKMFLLYSTPLEVIILSVALVAVYLARKGIEPMGRMAELLRPLITLLSLILFGLVLQEIRFSNLLPVFNTDPLVIIKAVPLVLFSFLGFELLLVFGGFVVNHEHITKVIPLEIASVGLYYLLLNTLTLLVFGDHQIIRLIWPTLSLFKTIEFPGLFIENVEVFVMGFWVFLVFMSIAPFLLGKVLLLAQLFETKEHNFFALPLIPILYFFSLLGDNIVEAYQVLDRFVSYASPIIAFVLPAILLAILTVKKKFGREKHHGQS